MVDFVTLEAFDFFTPARNPKEADYPAPLYELQDRKSDENVDGQVKYWLSNGFPPQKIILGIPTYGRAWAMDDESDLNGLPPIRISGPATPGPYTKDAGLLSFPEVCTLVSSAPQSVKTSAAPTPSSTQFRKISDSSKRKGTFTFKLADENNNGGAWIGYEEPETAGYKAGYAKAKGLGGVAIVDLTLDDFKGTCGRDKYDILNAAKAQL